MHAGTKLIEIFNNFIYVKQVILLCKIKLKIKKYKK